MNIYLAKIVADVEPPFKRSYIVSEVNPETAVEHLYSHVEKTLALKSGITLPRDMISITSMKLLPKTEILS